ncbi:MAG TPA: sigma-70 family RNA polymerase sigma factor [Gemmatimonadaceae bacterium]|nr:sigma-70 family RNA polymerase sigma factor [Gemmatimonadaceae bacterium]
MAQSSNRSYTLDYGLMSVHLSAETRSDGELAATYEAHFDLLVGIAVSRFGIDRADAETLAHEVFLAFLTCVDRINDQRAWLVSAIFNASKNYVRRAQRTEPLPEDGRDPADPRYARAGQQWPDVLAAREAFARLTPRCQLALRLRHLEGYTIPEIATILGTTSKYAAKLVGRCLDQAQRRYGGGGAS